MQAISKGFYYLISGFHLIIQPRLRRFVLIPFFINIACFVGLFYLSLHYWNKFTIYLFNFLPSWLHWLTTIFWLLFLFNFFIFFIFTFNLLANLITAPFNSFLAEKVEQSLTGVIPEKKSWDDTLYDIYRIIGRQLSLLLYYFLRIILICLLFFIPFLQLIAPIIMFIFHAWCLTLTYIDYPTDNHRIQINQVLSWLRERRLLSIAYGGLIVLVSMIPIINLFITSAATAGATKMWIEESKTSHDDI